MTLHRRPIMESALFRNVLLGETLRSGDEDQLLLEDGGDQEENPVVADWLPQDDATETYDVPWTPWQSRDHMAEMMAVQKDFCYPAQQMQTPSESSSSGATASFSSFTPRLTPETVGPTTSGDPEILVFPLHAINFTNFYVNFGFQVTNIPGDLQLTPHMFEGVAMSPNRMILPCIFKKVELLTNNFQGSFKATEEVGYYRLRLRMIIPLSYYGQEQFAGRGVIYKTAMLLVSRNYLRESQKRNFTNIQCDYQVPIDGPYRYSSYSASMSKIWGLACDKQTNRIFYTDRAAHSLTCIDPVGKILFKTVGNLNRPTGIACDELGRRLFIADKDSHRVSLFSMDGQYISSFGSKGHQNGSFSYPWDVAVSPTGDHLVVADSRNKRVQLFDRVGNFISKYSVFEKNPFEYKNSFDYPRGVCFALNGQSVYVTDFNVQNIMEIPIDMSRSKKLIPDGRLRRPQGIIVDSIGGLLVADSKNNCIRHLSPDGTLLSSIRSVCSETLDYPVNVATMAGGYLATLDGNARLRII